MDYIWMLAVLGSVAVATVLCVLWAERKSSEPEDSLRQRDISDANRAEVLDEVQPRFQRAVDRIREPTPDANKE